MKREELAAAVEAPTDEVMTRALEALDRLGDDAEISACSGELLDALRRGETGGVSE